MRDRGRGPIETIEVRQSSVLKTALPNERWIRSLIAPISSSSSSSSSASSFSSSSSSSSSNQSSSSTGIVVGRAKSIGTLHGPEEIVSTGPVRPLVFDFGTLASNTSMEALGKSLSMAARSAPLHRGGRIDLTDDGGREGRLPRPFPAKGARGGGGGSGAESSVPRGKKKPHPLDIHVSGHVPKK